jgi:hypothetical protein
VWDGSVHSRPEPARHRRNSSGGSSQELPQQQRRRQQQHYSILHDVSLEVQAAGPTDVECARVEGPTPGSAPNNTTIKGLVVQQQQQQLLSFRSDEIVDTDAALVPEYALLKLSRRLLASPAVGIAFAASCVTIGGVYSSMFWALASNSPSTAFGDRPYPPFSDAQAKHMYAIAVICGFLWLGNASSLVYLRRPLLEGGPLERLWGGLERPRKVTMKARRWLDFWALVISAVTVTWVAMGIVIASAPFADPDCRTFAGEIFASNFGCTRWSYIIYNISWGMALVGSWGFILPWLLSAIVATTLASDAVQDVSQAVRRMPPGPSVAVWQAQVEMPTIKLATDTMAELSQGWGAGAPWIIGLYVLGWFLWILWYCSVMASLLGTSALSLIPPLYRALLITFAFVGTCTLYIFAVTSTHCNDLKQDLNHFRLTKCGLGSSDWKPNLHERLSTLESGLSGLNKGSGMGFVIFGIVMDMPKLKQLGLAVATLGTPVLAAVNALGTVQSANVPAGGICALSALTQLQREVLQKIIVQFNASGCPSAAWANNTETIGSLFGH